MEGVYSSPEPSTSGLGLKPLSGMTVINVVTPDLSPPPPRIGRVNLGGGGGGGVACARLHSNELNRQFLGT